MAVESCWDVFAEESRRAKREAGDNGERVERPGRATQKGRRDNRYQNSMRASVDPDRASRGSTGAGREPVQWESDRRLWALGQQEIGQRAERRATPRPQARALALDHEPNFGSFSKLRANERTPLPSTTLGANSNEFPSVSIESRLLFMASAEVVACAPEALIAGSSPIERTNSTQSTDTTNSSSTTNSSLAYSSAATTATSPPTSSTSPLFNQPAQAEDSSLSPDSTKPKPSRPKHTTRPKQKVKKSGMNRSTSELGLPQHEDHRSVAGGSTVRASSPPAPRYHRPSTARHQSAQVHFPAPKHSHHAEPLNNGLMSSELGLGMDAKVVLRRSTRHAPILVQPRRACSSCQSVLTLPLSYYCRT